MKTFTRILLSLAVTASMATAAQAGTATDDLTVTATVEDSCTITGGTLAFGTYNTVSGAAVDASTTIAVACTTGATTTITMGQGANADTGSTDGAPARRMLAGTSYLAYKLYQDSGRATEWGNTEGTGKGYTAASSAASNLTVYGRIDASQDVPAGAYTDTVVATITF